LLAEANNHPLSSTEAASPPFFRDTRTGIAPPDNKSPSSTGISGGAIATEYKAGWQDHKKVSCSELDEETPDKECQSTVLAFGLLANSLLIMSAGLASF